MDEKTEAYCSQRRWQSQRLKSGLSLEMYLNCSVEGPTFLDFLESGISEPMPESSYGRKTVCAVSSELDLCFLVLPQMFGEVQKYRVYKVRGRIKKLFSLYLLTFWQFCGQAPQLSILWGRLFTEWFQKNQFAMYVGLFGLRL